MSSLVYEQLGGVVAHRGTDAWELADDTKLLQRLYALNILRLEGHQPDAALWTVRRQHYQNTEVAARKCACIASLLSATTLT